MADDFGKRVEAFGLNILQKAQKTIDIVGINNDIGTKERRLTQLYAEIGEAYCKAHLEDAQTEFPAFCEEAFALTREIASLQASVLRIKGYRECPSCHAMVDDTAAYCPSCGAAMPASAPEPVQEQEPDEAHCKQCGEKLGDDDNFCPNCGEKRD